MISKIRIESFRCIRELELDLEPLTVLVGPNASGKSTVLAALALNQRFAQADHRLGKQASIVALDGSGADRAAWSASHFQLDLRAMRQPNEVEQAPQLASNGGNLTNSFATLPRSQQSKVADDLVRLVDVLKDVGARPSTKGTHRLVFQDRWNEGRWFEPHEVSDGTLLVLAFLVLQYQEQRPDIICLEEPERGLHPYLLGQVIDLLRAISQGKHGPATQLVLATQSAELLDHVQPHEVRFLERTADGGVQARTAPIDDEAWADAIREYESSVGQMWLSGSLGGVPGT
jgi:predicted ATPase